MIPWWEPILEEPNVQIVFSDFCKPGDVVFDVGANFGFLSRVMSRLVGHRGIVCAFEASKELIARTQPAFIEDGCNNISLYHRAIYSRSNDFVELWGGGSVAGSIYHGKGKGQSERVRTLALDDFVGSTGLTPAFVKMDIEGAEYDALLGFAETIKRCKPTMVLEQSPTDMRCHGFLADAGYLAVDLATYRCVETAADFVQRAAVANLLYLPKDMQSPYLTAANGGELVLELGQDAFNSTREGVFIKKEILLGPGRYLVAPKFTASGQDNSVYAGINDAETGEPLYRGQTYTQFFAGSYSNWMIQLYRDRKISPYLKYVQGFDETLSWRGLSIWKFAGFSDFPSVTSPGTV